MKKDLAAQEEAQEEGDPDVPPLLADDESRGPERHQPSGEPLATIPSPGSSSTDISAASLNGTEGREPPIEPPPVLGTGTLLVTSTPSAMISLDGRPRGITPLELELDAGPHPRELGSVHVAILEDGLRQARCAVRLGEKRHQLRLHIGGKARIGCGLYFAADEPVDGSLDTQDIFFDLE